MSGMINFIYLQSKIIFIIYKKILKIRDKYCSRFQAFFSIYVPYRTFWNYFSEQAKNGKGL